MLPDEDEEDDEEDEHKDEEEAEAAAGEDDATRSSVSGVTKTPCQGNMGRRRGSKNTHGGG